MRLSPGHLSHPKYILVFVTLFILSVILSSAAVARSGVQPVVFPPPQQQPQQQLQEQQAAVPLSHEKPPSQAETQPQPPSQPQPQPQEQTQTHQPQHTSSAAANADEHEKSEPTAIVVVGVPVSVPTVVPTIPRPSAPPRPPPSNPSSSSSPPHSPPPSSSNSTSNQRQKHKHPSPIIKEYKYFREAGPSYTLTHYDERYYRHTLDYAQVRPTLQHLIRSYLSAFAELGLETWIAHGTLMGWWWNGQVLPWDWDVDTQVSGETMAVLRERYNGSVHDYFYALPDGDGGSLVKKRYLLDVNPFSGKVDRGRGLNLIDARWIDMDSGMFVDITALMERDPRAMPGVVSCKNRHTYMLTDLYPLRETEFEGVPALVPASYEGILVDEYGAKSLVVTEFEGHRFDPDLQEWVKITNANRVKQIHRLNKVNNTIETTTVPADAVNLRQERG